MERLKKICVVGLGYIGLPTASVMAMHGFHVLGVDINETLINDLKKGELHIDNPHKGKYDFDKLVKALPSLEKYVVLNPLGEKTIDFSNPEGVKS